MPELDSPVAYISFFLTVYTWGAVCILLLFLLVIAQFYEKKSGQRSYYLAFLLAIAFFVGATIVYLPLLPALTGSTLGDMLRFAGGITVGVFGFMLLNFMMGGRA